MGRPAKNKELERECRKIADMKNVIVRKYHISDIVCCFEKNNEWARLSFRSWDEVMSFLSAKV